MASKSNNAYTVFVALLAAYSVLFGIYIEYFYEDSPWGGPFVHIVALLTWLTGLFFTSPLGHDLNQWLTLSPTVYVHGVGVEMRVPLLRRGFLILGAAVQGIVLMYDVIALNYLLTCDHPDCSPYSARRLGTLVLGLMSVSACLLIVAFALWMQSFRRSARSGKDALLGIRCCVHCTRLVLAVSLIFLPDIAMGDRIVGQLASVLDMEWLLLVMMEGSNYEAWQNYLEKTSESLATPREALTSDGRQSRFWFRFLNAFHFAMNGAVLALFWIKEIAAATVAIRALQVLTMVVLFFTAHDRFALHDDIEQELVRAHNRTPVNPAPVSPLQKMNVKSSLRMRPRTRGLNLML